MDDDEKLENSEADENAQGEEKNAISADLIRGHINTIILRTLYERDKYGYEIIEEIENKSKGQYTLKQPTLYSALKRLESQGFINAYWKTDEVSQGGRRKYYTLTDSGRAITEKNQAEWEYSRTVIDNLISDRSFDFSNPAPTAVDFKILKNSTSRVRGEKKDGADEDEAETENEKQKSESGEQLLNLVEDSVITDSGVATVEMQYSNTVISDVSEADKKSGEEQQIAAQQESAESVKQETERTATVEQAPPAAPPAQPEQTEQGQQVQPTPVVNAYSEQLSSERRQQAYGYDEERRVKHENYLRLISQPVQEVEETPQNPYADAVDTERLIYNNKPEPERDYKNLISNIYDRTITKQPEPPKRSDFNTVVPHYQDAKQRAINDGLSVNTSTPVVEAKTKKTYNRNKTLFYVSCIIAAVMLLEFALCLIFRKNLGTDGVNLGYPFTILALGCAQLFVFFILRMTDSGVPSRKPVTHPYVTASIVISCILIMIVLVLAILLKVNFAVVGDILAKIVIPSVVILNIPAFAIIFYFMSK